MRDGLSHSIAALTSAIAVIYLAGTAGADEQRAPDQGASAPPAAVAHEPGGAAPGGAMRIYIDPATGKPTVPPSESEVTPVESGARAVPTLPRAVPNPGPAGGIMLDTKGVTFGFEATVEPGGKTVVECRPQSATPPTEE